MTLSKFTSTLHAVLQLKAVRATSALVLGGAMVAPCLAAVSGNISPNQIEIDGNLWPSNALPWVDWVKDALTNTDTAALNGNIATGIIPNVSGAVGGKGHWYGVRIVDGLDQGDQDIFLTGGKENDTSTWNVGPGSVGSAKYELSQAYIANNQNYIYFGMERGGNNGSTAFDFEFNQKPPLSLYVPDRSTNDVLFTFEMKGSGQSGSAVPHYFKWNGVAYVEQTTPPSLISVINQDAVPAGPWGYVNDKGKWLLGSIPKFQFAEASVLLTQAFPGFQACGTTAYCQVRTRASDTDGSDLKDTTLVFQFQFGGSAAVAAVYPQCGSQFYYQGTNSTDAAGNKTGLTYAWNFLAPDGFTVTPSSSTSGSGYVTVTFPQNWAGGPVYITNILQVADAAACAASTAPLEVPVFPTLSASVMKDPNRTNMSANFTAVAPAATSLQWEIAKNGAWVNIPNATNSTFTYTSFEQDSTNKFLMSGNLTFGSGTAYYEGYVYEVRVRLHAIQSIPNVIFCETWSDPRVIRKLIAVDP